MRKDIFIVGARLLGIWQLIEALTPLAYIFATKIGYTFPQSYSQEYNAILLILHLVVGLFLLFRTHRLYHLVNRLPDDDESSKQDEASVDNKE